ncbi:hypothetical protein [Vibrio parahaemolyticus]|uniref:hypothetical protein n=1 Tax=Vibrio parahaemolyticus TaxID=670 RepID=UPI00084B065A|nr:hypothetical protein [Vibrio parahaemolyticus]ODZ11032.1 hypothetical protein BBM99_05505 [Vibrio parahaemolyticus]
MALKNWTITAQGTKSAAARERYLRDKKHPNHRNTTAYLNIHGTADTTLDIIRNCERHKLKTALKGKGGRPPVEAQEFVLTFPKDVQRATKEQWTQILNKVLDDLQYSVNTKREALEKICRAVVHQQDRDVNGGSGDHMHMMIGKFTNNGKYLRELSSKSTLYKMKQSFNLAALEVLGVNHATYEPIKNYNGVAKKKAPQWKVKAARVYQNIDNVVVKKVERELENNKDLERIFDKFSNQAEKWIKAFAEEDSKQINRQLNRMFGTIEEVNQVDGLSYSEETLKAMNEIRDSINSQSEKALPEINPIQKPKPRSPQP